MPKLKLFLSVALILTLAATVTVGWAAPKYFNDGNIVNKPAHYGYRATDGVPSRDDDPDWTFRWVYSSDNGASWSGVMGAGNTGMFAAAGDGMVPAWSSDNFGVVVDGHNHLHFVGALVDFGDGNLNPLNRQNGVYDVRTEPTGENTVYTMIAAQGEAQKFTWADVGMDANGNLFAIWLDLPGETGTIWAAKSTNDGGAWSQPFQLATGLVNDGQSIYPHMTPHVGADFFYVVYQQPNAETNTYDHKVLKVPTSLSGEVSVTNTEASTNSAAWPTYYVGAVNAIDMDPVQNWAYFVVRNTANRGVMIGSSRDGTSWSVANIAVAPPFGSAGAGSRYPSIGVDLANRTPFAFSNYGIYTGVGDYHKDWLIYDEAGYGGGQWTNPTVVDSSLYGNFVGGLGDNLYVHTGAWTSSGRLISGCNLWRGSFTPASYVVDYSDDGGETWHGPSKVFSVFPEAGERTMYGGYVANAAVTTGANNYVFVTFSGYWGVTDLVGPTIAEPTLSSYNLGTPWVVNCALNDVNGIGAASVNFWWDGYPVDSLYYIDAPDTILNGDALDNGTYVFTMPNDTMASRVLQNGDVVNFFVDAADGLNNYNAGYLNTLTVGQGWNGVWQRVEIPNTTSLSQNYPNPFNNQTTIPFALSRTQPVRVRVWDTNGRLVAILADGKLLAGSHTVTWNTTGVTSGVYIYTLETQHQTYSAKMTLLH